MTGASWSLSAARGGEGGVPARAACSWAAAPLTSRVGSGVWVPMAVSASAAAAGGERATGGGVEALREEEGRSRQQRERVVGWTEGVLCLCHLVIGPVQPVARVSDVEYKLSESMQCVPTSTRRLLSIHSRARKDGVSTALTLTLTLDEYSARPCVCSSPDRSLAPRSPPCLANLAPMQRTTGAHLSQ